MRLLLIEIDRNDVKVNRRVRFQVQQNIQQRIAVFAARQAHHHLVAIVNHVEIGYRLPGQPAQALGELVRLVIFPAQITLRAACVLYAMGYGCVHKLRIIRQSAGLD